MIQFIGLLLVLVLIVFPLWAIFRIIALGSSIEELQRQLRDVRREIDQLGTKVSHLAAPRIEPRKATEGAAEVRAAATRSELLEPLPAPIAPAPIAVPREPAPVSPPPPPPRSEPVTHVEPRATPPIVNVPTATAASVPLQSASAAALPRTETPAAAAPPPRYNYRPLAPPEPSAWEKFFATVDWEQFMGAKLFAWLGGFAAFLGAAFFVKYSFEHDLIPPEVRVAIGYLLAIGLVVGGLKIPRARYAVTAQTLIATGVVILYAVTFACRSLYAFPVFTPLVTFGVMALITTAAFLLAVRLEAKVVAILGLLGGFLTPALLGSHHDNPAGLFGYIALLDLGLIAVALHRRWHFLVPLGAAGTILMQLGWAAKFFREDPDAKSAVAIVVSIGFSALFLGALAWARKRQRSSDQLVWSALALPCVCFLFAALFLNYPVVAARLGVWFTLVLLADVCVLTLAWLEGGRRFAALAAIATVVLPVGWLVKIFTPERAPALMAVVLAFAAVFLAAHVIARRLQRHSAETLWSAAALPLLAFVFALAFVRHDAVAARIALLFGFVFAATIALFALAWLDRAPRLVTFAAAGVVLVESVWIATALSAERAFAIMLVALGHSAVFVGAHLLARRLDRASSQTRGAAAAVPLFALAFGFAFIAQPAIAARPGLLFTFILVADLLLLALAWCDEQMPRLHLIAGGAVFALLAAWTGGRITAPLLPWALAAYLVYAALHTAFPLVLERRRPAAAPTAWSQIFPPLALLLMLVPLFRLEAVSLAFWPCVLLVDLIAIALAVITASIASVAVVLMLTLSAAGLWIFHVPATLAASTSLLVVIGGFAVLFFAAGMFLARRFGAQLAAAQQNLPAGLGDVRAQIPALSALLPFVLLIMMTQRLPLANPSSIFGLALLLVVLVLGLSRILLLEWLPACALVGAAALEFAWHARHFDRGAAFAPLVWYIVFYAVFSIFPFVFRRSFAALTGPWAIAALNGVLHFVLVYLAVSRAWPNDFLGLVPALFVLAPLASLVLVLRAATADAAARLNQLAWFGAIALLFITLIFPIQFDRQWLTIGWALEGAALLWLFHRVPHDGLRLAGFVLLCAGFARLALNPAVLGYHPRSTTGIGVLNWYLYTYGVVTACLFVGARLMAPPRDRVFGTNAPALLNTLGTVLAFLLVNIEIADFFSEPGARVLTFQFSGNFARDMTYTIAWALFALGLLLVSIARLIRAGRYAALALLGIALLKLFFHDLARLEALYRIGALFAVAVIAIVASFAYQRFLPADAKADSRQP